MHPELLSRDPGYETTAALLERLEVENHALAMRGIVAELRLRGWKPQPESPCDTGSRPLEESRIPVPKQIQSLWAQHKYSVMARSYQVYRNMGPRIARGGVSLPNLWLEFMQLLADPPEPRQLTNTLAHMWGYLKTRHSGGPPSDNGLTLQLIRSYVPREAGSYLWCSTALSELARFLHMPEWDTP